MALVGPLLLVLAGCEAVTGTDPPDESGASQTDADSNAEGPDVPDLAEDESAEQPDADQRDTDEPATPNFDEHPVTDAEAERAIELIRDPEHRRDFARRMAPDDDPERLEQLLDDYEAELTGTLAGDVLPHGGRPRPDVVVVETFTSGDDYRWTLPAACPGYVGDPQLTGLAWHVDLDPDEIRRVSPVHEANIC